MPMAAGYFEGAIHWIIIVNISTVSRRLSRELEKAIVPVKQQSNREFSYG
jgi:hypothetical protein